MKLSKTLTSLAFGLALMVGASAVVAGQSCCVKAKAAGKDCEHKCCVAAHKDGKTCEKCQPDPTCCDKAIAAGKACEHKCCADALKDKKVCEKCNPKKDDKKK